MSCDLGVHAYRTTSDLCRTVHDVRGTVRADRRLLNNNDCGDESMMLWPSAWLMIRPYGGPLSSASSAQTVDLTCIITARSKLFT